MGTEKNPIANMLNEIRDLGHYTDSQMVLRGGRKE